MKLSLNRLQKYFSVPLDWDSVWNKLTNAGIEIEEIKVLGTEFSGVVIARVIDCIPHPDADKLKVCTVDIGDAATYQIICGAANVRAGVVVPCAKIGAILPGGLTILARQMRGLTSSGMLCAGEELGLAATLDGLLLLPEDAPLGVSLREYLALDDQIIEFKITPNRGDCLSIKGLVREIAMLMRDTIKPEEVKQIAGESEVRATLEEKITLKNSAQKACPIYSTLVIKNVNNKIKLAEDIVRALERSGIRSISPIVDLANFVMLETGQPLHVFDLNATGNQLGVRFANDNEQLKLLNNSEVRLKENTLIIAKEKNEPVAIAGVMGGFDSGVTPNTTDIIIECAFFAPEVIAGIAKQYNAFSESATRFERGVDYGEVDNVIKYVAKLIQEHCGGDIGSVNSIVNTDNLAQRAKKIELPQSKIKQLIGVEISRDEIIAILAALEFKPENKGDIILVTPPTFRFDINIAEDVVEEIARCYGYDKIPAIMPTAQLNFKKRADGHVSVEKLKTFMVNQGFIEIVNYAFLEENWEKMLGNPAVSAIKLQNPIANLNVMRTSLIADLVKALKHNLNRGHKDFRLFEVGRVFLDEDVNGQPLKLAGLISGKENVANGLNQLKKVDFYDLKALVEVILFGYLNITFVPCTDYSVLHSGQCAKICSGKEEVGIIGGLHPKICQELSLTESPYVFELNLDYLSKLERQFDLQEVSKFPRVERDVAFIVDKKITSGAILTALNQQKGIEHLVDYHIFDIYAKENSTTKNVAINFVFQADKTLTEKEIHANMEIIIKTICSEFNAVIRS